MRHLNRMIVCLGIAFLPFSGACQCESASAEENIRKFGNDKIDTVAIRYKDTGRDIHAFEYIVREPIHDPRGFEMVRSGACGYWLNIKLTGANDKVLNIHRLPCKFPENLKKGEIITCVGVNYVDAKRAASIWDNTTNVKTEFKAQCLGGAKL